MIKLETEYYKNTAKLVSFLFSPHIVVHLFFAFDVEFLNTLKKAVGRCITPQSLDSCLQKLD